jgi:hypothetical protein
MQALLRVLAEACGGTAPPHKSLELVYAFLETPAAVAEAGALGPGSRRLPTVVHDAKTGMDQEEKFGPIVKKYREIAAQEYEDRGKRVLSVADAAEPSHVVEEASLASLLVDACGKVLFLGAMYICVFVVGLHLLPWPDGSASLAVLEDGGKNASVPAHNSSGVYCHAYCMTH